MDAGQSATDKLLQQMERKVKREYKKAEKEVAEKLEKYLERYKAKDAAWQKRVAAGQATQAEWIEWRKNQMLMADRWAEMRQTLAEDYYNANKIAGSIVNGYQPEVYALNHNYGTYEAEKGAMIDTSYTLYDRQTVERLMRDNPQMLPKPGAKVSEAIKKDKSLKWSNKKIQSVMLQGILQGESIPNIAKRLASTVGDSNMKAAIRNARTMTTGTQNAGRVDSYKRAQSMGIDLKQQWLATLDGRTRHTHRQLDGEIVEVGKKFSNKCRYPGDPEGPAGEIYNCRCTLIAALDGMNNDISDISGRNTKHFTNLSYDEWKNEHAKKATNKADAVDNVYEQFVPAKTKQEAVEFAKRFADVVNYNGISLDNANKINEQLLYLTQKYPISKIDEISNKSKGVMSANYHKLGINRKKLGTALDDETMNFNLSQAMNRASIKRYRERYQGRIPWDVQKQIDRLENKIKYSRWGVHSSYDNHVQCVVTHEYGHVLSDQYFGMLNGERANPAFSTNWQLRQMNQRWSDAYKKAMETGDIFKLSEYGGTNVREFFAESFLAREMGEKLPDYVESLMDEVIKNGIMS